MKKTAILNLLIIVGIISTLLYLYVTSDNSSGEPIEVKVEVTQIDSTYHQECNDTLSLENVKKYLELYRVENRDIVYAQIRLESGNLTSFLTRNNNNFLGMKYPHQRPTTSIGEKNGFANYENWKDCIQDYAIWQSRYAKKLSKEEYFSYLEEVYAESPTYISKLKELINE